MTAAKKALLRLARRGAGAPRSGTHMRTAMRVEEVERRILHSADFTPILVSEIDSAQVQMRVLEAMPVAQAQAVVTEDARRHELVAVDTSVADYQQLVDDITAQADSGRSFDFVLIDSSSDGIARIGDALLTLGDVDALHIISHGSAGAIRLGSTVLDYAALQARAAEIEAWSSALSADADVLIYGCEVAESAEGRALVDALALLTGADVAGSDDVTGNTANGGDWTLEYRAGSIEAAVATSAAAQQSWQGTLANASPVLTGANNLTGIDEDAATNAGTLVSDLIATHVTDADPGALTGIAVTGVVSTTGTWEYSSSGGAWTAFGAPTATAARLLAADANTYVRFVPNADWNGTVTNGLTFRAWDQTAGTAGTVADTTAFSVGDNFSAAAYTNNDGNVAWATDWADSDADATSGQISIAGGQLHFAGGLLSSSSISRQVDLATATSAALTFDFTNAIGLSTITLEVSANGGGSWTQLANSFAAAGSASFDIGAYVAADTQIRFTVAGVLGGGTFDLDNLKIAYVKPASGGTLPFSSATASSSVTVASVNDAPAGAGNTLTTDEDTALTFTAAHFGFTDAADTPANALAAVKITTLATAGSITLSGAAVTAGQVISVADINAGNLKFTPAANANGAAYASFTFQVQDDGGGANLDATARTMTVNVTAVNDAPVGTGNTVTTAEDTVFTFTAAHFGFTDAADTPANALAAVKITTLASAGSLTLSGVAVTAGQVITVADIDANNLKFTPAANANGAAYASFTFQVQDDGGGANLDATARTMTVNVTSVNDAPIGTSNTLTTNEDTALVFTAAHFGLTDPSDSPANALAAVKITTLASAGSLTLSGAAVTAGQTIAVADIDAGNLRFTPAANANGAAYASFTFQVQDDGGGANLDTTARTMTVNVTAVNDAPIGTSNTLTTNEDTALVFTAAHFGFTDAADTPANALAAVKITTLASAGSLTLSGAAVTAGQTIAVADITAGNLRFTPAANANGAAYASFTFQVQDDGGGANLDTAARTMTVDVTAVQDAPVLSGANNLTATNEDAATNAGTLVSALIAGHLTDPDIGALSGIAVTAVNNTNGTWQYSINGGGAWASFGTPSTGAARLLAADANTYVRFVPNANWSGTVANGLTFYAWDQTSGTNGGSQSTISNPVFRDNFGAVSYANNDGTGSWSAGWVDSGGDPAGGGIRIATGHLDIRSNTGDSIYREASLTGATSATLSFSYTSELVGGDTGVFRLQVSGDGGASYTTLRTFTSASNTGSGTISADITAYVAASTRIKFDVTTTGTPPRSLLIDDLQIACIAPGMGASASISSAVASSSATVNAANDAPAGANGTVTVNEDVAHVFSAADFALTDTSDTPANSLLAVKVATLPVGGSLTLNGVAVTAAQFISVADISAGKLVYTPGANAHGAGYASFTFRVQDDGGTANGGVDLDTTARTMTVNVTAVNDAPVGTSNTVTTNEDSALTFTAAHFGFTDPSDTPANTLAAVKITTLATAGSLTLSGAAVTAGQSITVGNINAGNLRFTPAANANGAAYASFTFQVQDNGGGADLDSTARTMTVSVTSVNDAPVGTSNTVTTNEDTALAFTAAHFGLTDPSDTPANALAAVKITTLATAGSLTLSGAAVTAGQSITVADIAAGNLRFTPAANANGAAYASFTFQVQDDGGGANLDTTARTMTVNVTAVNDAPAGVNTTVGTLQDTPFVVEVGNFGYSDADAAANVLLAVKIATLPAAGALTLDGVAVTAGQFISAADIVANKLVYTPGLGGAGAGYASFTFQVQDDGGVANGGTDLDPVARTLTIDVGAINHAPLGTSTTAVIAEDTPYVFGAASFGFSDPNDGTAHNLQAAKITTVPATGALTLSGVAVAAGQFISAVDIAAGNLVFTPAANANGAGYAAFTFQVQDDGGVANGGVDLDTTARTFTLDVTAVNDAPIGTSSTVTINEDTALTFTAAHFGLTDPSDTPANALAAVRITTVASAGSLTLSGAAVTAGQTIAVADIDAGNLRFTPVANANGAAYSSFTFQVQDDGGGANLDTTARTLTVNVTSVNDAPIGTSNTVTINEDTALTFTAAHFGYTDAADSPANALAAVKITTLTSAGSLTLSGAAVTAGQTIALADIAAGNLRFTPAANANGAAYASFTFQVQDDGGGADLDTTARTMTVSVTSVQDAPLLAGANNLAGINEDPSSNGGTLVSALIAGQTSDPDAAALSGIAVIAVDNTNGTWQYSTNGGGAWASFGTPSAGSARLLAADASTSVRFVPDANWNGTVAGGITFRAWDQTQGSNGSIASTLPNPVLLDNFGTAAYSNNDGTANWAANWVDTDGNPTGGRIRISNGELELRANGGASSIYREADLSGASAATLSFSYNNDLNDGAIAVQVSGDGGATYTTLGIFSDNSNSGGGNFSADISAYISASTRIRFQVTSASSDTLVIDDLRIAMTAPGNGGGAAFSTTAVSGSIMVSSVNDAPAGTSNTVTTSEDTAFTFTAAHFGYSDNSDSPANALAAVRITTLVNAGALTLNGVAVVAGQSVSVADIAAGDLVFTPVANANGAAYASFTFQVQDDGGGSDLDTTARTMTVNVTSVNDAPIGTSNTVTTSEDTDFTFAAAHFGYTDPSDSPANSLAAVTITTGASAGSLTLSGVAVTAGQSISVADINAGNLKFTPAANANGAGYASFTFQVQDDGASLDTTARTMMIDVTAVNDVPAGTSNTVSTNEDTVLTFTAAHFGYTDAHDSPADALAAVKITTVATAGVLTLSGAAVSAGQSVSAADIAAGNLKFTPAANANGTAYASFTFQVQDDGGGASLDPIARTMTIDVSPVNDAPVGNDTSVGTSENASLVLRQSAFGFTDPDDSPANSLLAVTVVSLPAAGTLTLSGAAVSAGQTISAADLAAGNLVYTPLAGTSGAGYASFTYQVQDGGGTALGGADLDASVNTVTIDVGPINHAPIGTPITLATLEDAPLVLSVSDFGFSDANDNPARNLLAVRITAVPVAGTLTLNGAAVTAGQFIGVADIAAGKLVYAPGANGNGTGYSSFTFQVQDDGGTALGGADLDTTARVMTIDVTAVNDAPTGMSTTVVATEDAPFTFTTAAFGFGDASDSNALLGVRITALPGAGALELNGIAVTAGQLVTAADIAAGNLVFASAANASGAGYASFAFKVQDDGGTANGGADLDALARTITIDVAPVNDAPAGASITVTTNEDVAYVFGADAFGYADAADANALFAVKITTVPAAGALTLSGIAVTAGQFVSAADIVAGNLVYVPTADANGAAYASFTFRVQDDGGTARGGVDLDATARTLTIAVVAVNDAPTGTGSTVSTDEDTPLVFDAAAFGFADAADGVAHSLLAVKIGSLPAAGTLTLNGAAVSAGQLVSAGDIAAGRLVYTAPANAHGAGYAGLTFQVQDDGGTANGGADLDPVARTMTIDVASVNDAPSGTASTVTMGQETTYTFDAARFGYSDASDTPANGFAGVKITSLPGAGTLSLNGAAVAAGQTVARADLDAGKLAFYAAGSGANYASFAFQVQDDGAGAALDTVARTVSFNVSAKPAPVIEIVEAPVQPPAPAPAPAPVAVTPPAPAPAAPAAPKETPAPAPAVKEQSSSEGKGSSESASSDTASGNGGSGGAKGDGGGLGATFDAAPVVVGETFVQGAVQRLDAQQNRDTRVPLLTVVSDAAVPMMLAQAQTEQLSDSAMNFSTLQSSSSFSSATASGAGEESQMVKEMNEVREKLGEQTRLEATTVAASAATTAGLSVGYVVWLLRGGVLVSTVLSSLPAWRLIDPLPILERMDEDDDDDDDTLESMVARNNQTDDTAGDRKVAGRETP